LRLEYRRKLIYDKFLVASSCPNCSIWVFSDILVSTWWWPTHKRAETCTCFL
jgi:hypothetical protein